MPTAELPARSGVDLNGISSLANLFLGKSGSSNTQNSGGTTTSGSVTTSSNVSQDAINAVVQSILQGSQGLASVASGQRRAGLYNSSTNQMLVNDLIARASAEGAKLNKTETTTQSQTVADNRSSQTNTNTPAQVKPSTAAAGLAGIQAISSLANSAAGKKILESMGLGSGTKTAAGPNLGAGGGSSAPVASVNDGLSGGEAFGGNAPTSAGMGATSSVQSVGSYANNPSAFIAGSNEQVVNSLGGGAGEYLGAGDLSFDQTYDPTGDFLSGIGEGIGAAADGLSTLGGVTGDWGVDPSTIDYGSVDMGDLFDFAEGGLVTKNGNDTLIRKYADGGYVSKAGPKNDEINPEAVRQQIAGYSRDRGSNYVSNAIQEEDRARRDYNNNSTGDADSQRRRAILADRYHATQRALNQPEAGAGRGRGYAGGGYVNIQAEKAFDSGGDEPAKNTETTRTRDSGFDFFRKPAKSETAGNDPRAASPADYTPNKSLGVRIIDKITGRDKNQGAKGYAKGGLVQPDITNVGLRAKSGHEVDATDIMSGNEIVGSIFGQGTRAANGLIKPSVATQGTPSQSPRTVNRLHTGSAESLPTDGTEGTPGTGVVGSPEANNAAVNGAIALGLTTALGIPSIVGPIAMNALGIPNSQMNPMSQLVSMITGLIGPDGMAAAANAASAANTAPTQSDQDAAVANGIAADTNTDPLDALIGIVSDPNVGMMDNGMNANTSNDGTSAEGGGIGGSGNSAGGDSSNGEGDGGTGPGGGGTANAKRGGLIKGPGTSTSDSIPARLSDGEYVIKAAVVDHYGKDFFDRLNQSIQVAS